MGFFNIILSFPFMLGGVVFMIIMKFIINKGDNGYHTHVNDFIKREELANNTIKNIDEISLEYIQPKEDNLPFMDLTELETTPEFRKVVKKQNAVKRKMGLSMVRLPINLSNTELKELFGANNFEKISIMEAHYNGYIRAVYEWAMELFELKKYEECKLVLLELVRLKGDISNAYVILAILYKMENNTEGLVELVELVNLYELSLKESTIKSISKIMN